MFSGLIQLTWETVSEKLRQRFLRFEIQNNKRQSCPVQQILGYENVFYDGQLIWRKVKQGHNSAFEWVTNKKLRNAMQCNFYLHETALNEMLLK